MDYDPNERPKTLNLLGENVRKVLYVDIGK